MSLSRRELLCSGPIAAVAAGLHSQFTSAVAAEPLIVRMQEPRNLETPLADLFAPGTDKFFVRSHFATPEVDTKTFALTVGGHVENTLSLTLDDLKKMESVSREIVLECAGNGRVFLVPQARGLQWGHGAVGQAKWTGVPLGAVLERAKVKTGAGDVVLVGADKGAIADPATPGPINFDRGIPLAKAKKDETLLVWNMNDEPLTASHGAPLRAIVGGWYGMAAVKWLSRIVVLDKPHAGFFQTFDYSVWERAKEGLPQLVPVTAIQPKAVITAPGVDALAVGKPCTIEGYTWAGENSVSKVEVSTDGGKNWFAANGKAEPFKSARWTASFVPQKAGPLKLVARCTDDKGTTQSDKRDADRRTYMINHLVPVEVTVK
ncbi:sulfite oxidase [Gemmata sp. G18]|uniref:Sulfite oxidase n=1 Tax=Gemmata palustris TaxID=2822762 RepID=A0ABS5C2I1_9BACT|nr:sulfite oxidase [Gemmata palustris]MBP3960189.1 sulfite oxidase [Gemmata palustris]